MKQVLFWILLVVVNVASQAEEYALDTSARQDTVIFESSAKLEFIKGKTNNIVGWLRFDPQNPKERIACIFRVDLRTLKTGIALRDEHMRERHLQTDEYPYAYFELLSVEGMPDFVKEDSLYEVTAEGYFYIHGVKRKIDVALHFTVTKAGNGKSRVVIGAAFSVLLDDFNIPRPRALFYKLAEKIDVKVVMTAYSDLSPILIHLPDWQEIR
jgi:polyisoprenoid-binding protein YceI